MLHELGPLLIFEVIDKRSFTAAALCAPGAAHFEGAGGKGSGRLPVVLDHAREQLRIDRPEAREAASKAFRLENASRKALLQFVTYPGRRPAWWLYHWWVYSDQSVLVSCYDWPDGPNLAHPSLRAWAEELEAEGIIKVTGSTEVTEAWYEQQEREDREERESRD
jgi:hypothetical protein